MTLLNVCLATLLRAWLKNGQKRDARNFGDDYALDQRARSLINQRQAVLAGNEGLFAEGAPVDYIAGTSGPTPGGIVGGSMFTAPETGSPAGEIGTIMLPSTTVDTSPFAIDDTTDFSSDARRDSARRPAAPSIGGLPTESIANAKADAQRDDTLRFLRGAEGAPTDNRSLIDAIDAGKDDSGRAISGTMGVREGLYFPETYAPEVTSLNERALDFLKSDTSVPREQIYDLGPRGVLKYEEAGDEEFTSVSDRLAREAAAGEQAASDASLTAQDAAADAPILAEIARQAEARRMRRINEIPEKGYQSIAQKKKEADFAAANPFVTGVIDPIIGASIDAGGLAGRTAADMFEAGVDFNDRVKRKRADEAEETLMGMPVTADPNKSAIQLENEKQASATALAAIVAGDKPSGGKGGGKTSSGSGQGRIADLIADRKKQGDQDKWLALAQAGLSLMSSGDFGKAGQQGLAALMAQRAQMNKFDTDMLKLESDLALNNARIAASRSKGTGSGLNENQMLTRGNELLKSGQTMLENAGDNADDAQEARLIMAAGRELIRRATGRPAAAAASSVIRTPSANQTG